MLQDVRAACDMAADKGIKVGLECHLRTVTENYSSANRFMEEAGRDNLYFYWQPNQFLTLEENIASAQALLHRTVAVHVFHWIKDRRYPLAAGTGHWMKYLSVFKNSNVDLPLLLEFMHDDRLESLQPTAKTLTEIVRLAESGNAAVCRE